MRIKSSTFHTHKNFEKYFTCQEKHGAKAAVSCENNYESIYSFFKVNKILLAIFSRNILKRLEYDSLSGTYTFIFVINVRNFSFLEKLQYISHCTLYII